MSKKILIVGYGIPTNKSSGYTSQLVSLLEILADAYDITYLPMSWTNVDFDKVKGLPIMTFDEFMKKIPEATEKTFISPILEKIKYSHSPYTSFPSFIRPSDFNKHIVSVHGIDLVITLSDVFLYHKNPQHTSAHFSAITKEEDRTGWGCRAISWFPCHYDPLSKMDLAGLSSFTDIVTLAPSIVQKLKEKIPIGPNVPINGLNPRVYIEHIPHIVEPNITKTRAEIRNELKIPEDTILIVYNGMNYEGSKRKGHEFALEIFSRYIKLGGKGFLYMHSPKDARSGIALERICESLNLPTDRYRLDQVMATLEFSQEITSAADIFLFPSKSEGFSLTLVEAQVFGIPTITTDFGALSDYNFNGIKIPPACLEWNDAQGGHWSLPDVNKYSQALLEIEKNLTKYKIQSTFLQPTIKQKFSKETVKNKWIKLIEKPFTWPPKTITENVDLVKYFSPSINNKS